MNRVRRLLLPLLLPLAACSSSPSAPIPPSDSGATPIDAAAQAAEAGEAGDAGVLRTPADAGTAEDATPAADASAAPDAQGPPVTRLRVHYPAGSHAITVRGSLAPFSWNQGISMASGADDTWSIATTSITSAMEWKPLLDDETWSRGPNYRVRPGTTVDVYPHFMQVSGQYSRAFELSSQILGNTRGVWIYRPPTYLENTRAPMPVLYMHDGQNLFDAQTAFGGNEWRVDETMDAAAEDGSIAETIVIGIENTSARISEYTPVPDPQEGGGEGDRYLRMIIEELKPRIDQEMRTLPDREHTSLMGSSLGGLISAYAGVVRSDVFGLIGAMSPSTWWDDRWIIGEVALTPASPRPIRVYVDCGDSGPSGDGVADTRDLAAAYRMVGYVDGMTFDFLVQAGGQHNEIYWAQRLPAALAFLLGPGR
jgi:predicted alpha/beta superfamily hydrolase